MPLRGDNPELARLSEIAGLLQIVYVSNSFLLPPSSLRRENQKSSRSGVFGMIPKIKNAFSSVSHWIFT